MKEQRVPRLSGGDMLKKQEAAGISLFFACIMISLLLLNIIVLGGAKNLLLQTQAGNKLEQETERALSLYDVKLYSQYGLWGMHEKLAEWLAENEDVEESFRDIDGAGDYAFALSDPLLEPLALQEQINAFMKPRFPLVLAEQLLIFMKQIQGGVQNQELALMDDQLAETQNNIGVSEFSDYLDTVKDNEVDETSENLPSSGGLTVQVLSALKKELQDGLASGISLGGEQEGSAVEAENIFQLLADAQAMMDFEVGTGYERLGLNEYALRMFPAQVHVEGLAGDYPITESLRGHALEKDLNKTNLSVEFLLTGAKSREAEQKVRNKLYLIRLACQIGSILGNKEKMELYRKTAEILALAIAVVSIGEVSIPPEAITYSIVGIIGLKEAAEDTKKLIKGEAAALLPYTENMKTATRYHDYLRLMLMTVPQEQLLERLCVSIKEDFGSAFYISANLELDWSSPYFAEMHEVFTLRRSYAVYDKKTIAKD